MPIQLEYLESINKQVIDELGRELDLQLSGKIITGLESGFQKWEDGVHRCMNLYVLGCVSEIPHVNEKNLSEIARVTVPLEILIQSLDDTVDLSVREKRDRWNDEVIKFFGFIHLFLSLFRTQKKNRVDILKSSLFKTDPVAIRFLKEIASDVTYLTEIPFIEKDYAKKIGEARNSNDETSLSLECYSKRSNGVEIYFKSIKFILPKIRDELGILSIPASYKRSLELLNKDLYDLHLDLKNDNPTPVTALFKKYGYSRKFYDGIWDIHQEMIGLYGKSLSKISPPRKMQASLEYLWDQINIESKGISKALSSIKGDKEMPKPIYEVGELSPELVIDTPSK